jgi:outer membrane protein assembly factor BamB
MLKTAALQLYHSHSSQNTGDILINLPFVDNQTLSALITVDTNSESSQEFVSSFLQLLKELSLELEIKTSNQPLEKLLGELNARLPRLPKASHFLTQLNCALAWQNQPEVHFTACGRIKIFLIKETTIKEIHLEKSEGQVFQQILQGNLQEKDSLLFSSYSLLDYVSQDKIKKTITTLPLTGAMAYLENILSKAPQKSCFWALAIKASEKEVNSPSISPTVPKIISQQAPSSLDRMLATKKNTAAILDSPTFAEFTKEQANRFLAKINNKIVPTLWHLFKAGSKDYGLILLQGLRFIIKLANYRNWSNLSQQWKKFWQEIIGHWQNLGRVQKVTLLLIVIILTILTQSLKWQTKLLIVDQGNSQWEQTIKNVEDNLNKIQAALIYNDKKAVIELLASIDPNLQNPAPAALQDKINQLRSNVATIQSQIWKINQVKEDIWQDLQTLKQPLSPIRLIASSDQRVYLITKEKQIYIFDTNNGEKLPPKLSENFPLLPEFIAPIITTKSFIGITNDKKSYLVNDQSFKALNWSTNLLNQPQALTYYGNRIYVADNNRKIIRYSISGENLTEETSWLKTSTADDIKDLGVDGDLYLLTKGGLLEKYNRGQKINWTAEPIDITLTNARLWVSQTSNQLYLFDQAKGRLITFEKNGQLVGQITNPLLSQALDWTILEKNKLLLITTTDKIYSFKLP